MPLHVVPPLHVGVAGSHDTRSPPLHVVRQTATCKSLGGTSMQHWLPLGQSFVSVQRRKPPPHALEPELAFGWHVVDEIPSQQQISLPSSQGRDAPEQANVFAPVLASAPASGTAPGAPGAPGGGIALDEEPLPFGAPASAGSVAFASCCIPSNDGTMQPTADAEHARTHAHLMSERSATCMPRCGVGKSGGQGAHALDRRARSRSPLVHVGSCALR